MDVARDDQLADHDRPTDPELPHVHTPAEIEAEDQEPARRLDIFSDRYGSPWLVVPIAVTLIVALYKFLFQRETSCPTKTKR